jgi:hypothetical protein
MLLTYLVIALVVYVALLGRGGCLFTSIITAALWPLLTLQFFALRWFSPKND